MRSYVPFVVTGFLSVLQGSLSVFALVVTWSFKYGG